MPRKDSKTNSSKQTTGPFLAVPGKLMRCKPAKPEAKARLVYIELDITGSDKTVSESIAKVLAIWPQTKSKTKQV